MKKIYEILVFISPSGVKKVLKKIKLGYSLIYNNESYLNKTGYVHSKINDTLQNVDGEYIPWMNYPIIDFLNRRLRPDMKIFEYGSGASTMYFSKRTQKIVSVEYDQKWFDKVKETLSETNSRLHFFPLDENYANAIIDISGEEKYDIIIVDGRKRVKCAKNALDFLSSRGVLILDDSSRPKYQEVHSFYIERGFRSISFSGLKPTGHGIDETTIFYRTINCIDL